ncbi:hypothetical protein GCM10025857_00690 [Alicyclobacillus contaminans]|uniref:tetratricopeptide repeat protein n=1 Tax=Alicyclobacillus contaminans TaxID=392016 RepID=UPI0004258A0F|nr:tetratricopeptide repeat protein [Alicyclobacillus contaminans]GMA48712.1 hypothetical protein GCM10025857_00690 [Alicyclobacillus contaminans]
MPDSPWFQTACAYLFIRDFDRALNAFRRAMEEHPDDPDCYFHASITALRSGRLDDAERWAAEARRLSPQDSLYEAHWQRVQADRLVEHSLRAWRNGLTEDALRLVQKALELNPLNDQARILEAEWMSPSPGAMRRAGGDLDMNLSTWRDDDA